MSHRVAAVRGRTAFRPPMLSGLVDYWTMDEASGNRLNPVRVNPAAPQGSGIASAAGQVGNCVTLDGTSGTYLSLSSYPLSGCSEFTWLGWVWWDGAAGNWMRIWDFGLASQTGYIAISPHAFSTNDLRFILRPTGGAEQALGTGAAFPSAQWVHVCVARSATGNQVAILQNGVQKANSTTAITHNPSEVTGTNGLYFGKSQFSDPYFGGKLDEQGFWNRQLTPPEVRAHYDRTPYPISGAWKSWKMFTFFWPTSTLNGTFRLLHSSDGVTFTDLPTVFTPSLGLCRDPDVIYYSDGYYWMVYTAEISSAFRFGLARSRTGLLWQEVCLVSTEPVTTGGGHVYAPAWMIDPADGSVHVLVGLQANGSGTFQIYELHPTSSDWTSAANWSAPAAIGGLTLDAIDPEFQYVAGDPNPYRIWFANSTGYIGYAKSASLLSGYSLVHDGSTDWLGAGFRTEGPNVVKRPDGTYRLYFDQEGQDGTVNLYYLDSADASFTSPGAKSQCAGANFLNPSYALHHGCVLPS